MYSKEVYRGVKNKMKLNNCIIGILIALIPASVFQWQTKVIISTTKRATEIFPYRLLIGIQIKSVYGGVGHLKHAHDGQEGDFVHQHLERTQPMAWFRHSSLRDSYVWVR